MKFPASVRVGHLDLPIRVVTRKAAELMGAPAWFDDDALEICVRDDMPAAKTAEAFMHEFFHAVFFASDNHDLTDEQEERVVRCLSAFTLMALRDNPDIFRALVRALRRS